MAANAEIPVSLNEQQIMMLRLLKNPLPDKDFQQIRRLAIKLLSQQLAELTYEWEKQNNITADDYDKLAQSHFRSKHI